MDHFQPRFAESVLQAADVGHDQVEPRGELFRYLLEPGRSYFEQWWIGAFPGLAILSVALAFNIMGDSLRDHFDPRYRNR